MQAEFSDALSTWQADIDVRCPCGRTARATVDVPPCDRPHAGQGRSHWPGVQPDCTCTVIIAELRAEVERQRDRYEALDEEYKDHMDNCC